MIQKIDEISKQTGLTKEQIRLKAIEMFKERERILFSKERKVSRKI